MSAKSRGTFKMLSRYIVADKALLAKALALLLVGTALDVVGPLLAKIYIDDYLMQGVMEPTPLITLLLIYLACQLGAAGLRFIQALSFTEMALNAVQDIRKRAFARVIRLPMSYFDHARTGQLVSRITNDTEAIKDLYVQFLSNVLGNVVMLVGILIAMALLDPTLMLIALGLVPAVVGIIYLYQKLSGPAVAHSRELRSDINANINESIGGMAVIQASNQSERFLGSFGAVNQEYYRARMRTIRASGALLRPAIDLLSILTILGLLTLFGQQVVAGVAEVGVLYAFLSYMGRFTEPLAEITQRFNLYQQAMVAGDRVATLLQEEEQHYGDSPRQLEDGTIRLNKLSFAYQADKPVLHQLELAIPDGGFYAIVGHTGSGKSTLLSLLLDFYPAQRGQIELGGSDINDLCQQALRQGIGLIPQEPFILADTVFNNIDMGRGLSQEQVEQAAHKAHLHQAITGLPNGYQTELGEGGLRLSTGQRQQLVIARALAAQPKILLLDEATANIDSETEQVVQQALAELQGKVTLIAVAHRLSTIKQADQIVLLAQGRISEQGTHAELMALEGGTYQAMYRLQQQAARVEALEEQ
ncbi:ABC transporter ATP-binding protein [Ferrimonas marina]|uniref:ATP-binding cassette, subfamily C n=1 Tax=Ferrimonas marina TaxID=299255 RepID=A0A1M5NRA6_9GAMM|nr:ABC transporter transmembrane domain-containing protein [Ferrimonas marina]SHG92091.1 ATP-binding cassette, subfamily C [Ferrimonas marina]